MTVPLFSHLASIRQRLATADHVLLGLGYDGTLTPLVDDPTQARLGPEMRAVLRALAGRLDFSLAIISGRALDDLRKLVELEGVIYGGNHGLDISGPGLRFVEETAVAALDSLESLAQTMACRLQPFGGAFVENKALTISVHYRCVARQQWDDLRRLVEDSVAETRHRFRLTLGHQVLEIRPRLNWHKGRVLRWIKGKIGRPNILVLYLGDDETDEDAFDALREEITIKVGNPEDSSAHFHVASPDHVREFLYQLQLVPSHAQGAK